MQRKRGWVMRKEGEKKSGSVKRGGRGRDGDKGAKKVRKKRKWE